MAPKGSCLECRRRKIKCSRERPCGYCLRVNERCVYPPPHRSSQLSDNLNAESLQLLLDKVARLEALVRQPSQSVSPGASEREDGAHSSRSSNIDNEANLEFQAPVVRDKEEVPTALAETSQPRGWDVTPFRTIWAVGDVLRDYSIFRTGPAGREYGFIRNLMPSLQFPSMFVPADWSKFLPSLSQIFCLWQTYVDRVDPVLKLFHAPTVQRRLVNSMSNLEQMPPDFAALLFAVLFAAEAASPFPKADPANLPRASRDMLQHLHCGLEAVLVYTDIMRNPTMITVQALTLYLSCARQQIDPALAWSLIGLVIRLAMKLGLERDQASERETVFEREMRRRLWWHICVLDMRVAESNNLEPSLHERHLQVPFPMMLNDNVISPDMTDAESDKQDGHEMLYCSMRFEFTAVTRRILFSSSFNRANGYVDRTANAKIEYLASVQKALEQKYKSGFSHSTSMIALSRASFRVMFSKLCLAVRLSEISEEDLVAGNISRDLLQASISIIEHVQRLRNDEQIRSIWWLPQQYLEWDAVAVLLQGFCSQRPEIQDLLDKARDLLRAFFATWRNTSSSVARHERWVRLETLNKKAFASQPRVLLDTSEKLTPTSDIQELDETETETQESRDANLASGDEIDQLLSESSGTFLVENPILSQQFISAVQDSLRDQSDHSYQWFQEPDVNSVPAADGFEEIQALSTFHGYNTMGQPGITSNESLKLCNTDDIDFGWGTFDFY